MISRNLRRISLTSWIMISMVVGVLIGAYAAGAEPSVEEAALMETLKNCR